jgi:hypothetical protein
MTACLATPTKAASAALPCEEVAADADHQPTVLACRSAQGVAPLLYRPDLAWALTGAVMTVAHRPLWYAVGVVLMVLGFGVVGWVARGLLGQQPLRQRTQAEVTGRTGSPRLGWRRSRLRGAWPGGAGSGGTRRPAA